MCVAPNYLWKRDVKEGRAVHQQSQRFTTGHITSVIENAYTSKTDDDDDYNNDDDDYGNKIVIDTRKELLCPIAIAQMMPQPFWSVVSHCRPSSKSEYYLPVEDML